MRRGLLAVGILALVAALAAAAWALRSDGSLTISGDILVKDLNIRMIGESCAGARPFLHVHPGAEVVIRDAEGETVAEGTLEGSEAVLAYAELEELERAPSGCMLSFEVAGVPELDSYTIEVAGRHEVTKTRSELEDDGWFVEMEVP